MTTAITLRISTKKLLEKFDENRTSGREILATLCSCRARKISTEKWLRILKDCHADDKRMVWEILKKRADISPRQLDAIDFYCRVFTGSVKIIGVEAHNLAVSKRKEAQAVAA